MEELSISKILHTAVAAQAIGSALIPHPSRLASAHSVSGLSNHPQPGYIAISMDSKQLAQYALNDLTQDLKLNGMGRYWR